MGSVKLDKNGGSPKAKMPKYSYGFFYLDHFFGKKSDLHSEKNESLDSKNFDKNTKGSL